MYTIIVTRLRRQKDDVMSSSGIRGTPDVIGLRRGEQVVKVYSLLCADRKELLMATLRPQKGTATTSTFQTPSYVLGTPCVPSFFEGISSTTGMLLPFPL